MDSEGDGLGPDAVPEPVVGAGSANDLDSSGSFVNESVGDRVESRDSTVGVSVNERKSSSDAVPELVGGAGSVNDLDSSGSFVNESVGDRVESRDSTVGVSVNEQKSSSDAVPELVRGAGSVNDLDSSGSFVNESVGDRVESRDSTVGVSVNERKSSSPGVNSASPGASGESAPRKGYGLKKWKRIRRVNAITKTDHDLDIGKALKRGLSGSNNISSPSSQLAVEKQDIANIVEHVNLLEKNVAGLNYFPAQASSSIAFAVGAVSENSEDQSSRSSTAASAPRQGFDIPSVSVFSWNKNKPKNLSGKGSNNSPQKAPLGRGRADPSKKLRGGERVKYEKENSHSSMESDSRSSNFVFMQASNGRQSEASINYNEETDEDIQGEPQFSDDQTAQSKVIAQEVEDISLHNIDGDFSCEGGDKNGWNHQPPARVDPLVDSLRSLDSAKEALEKELQKFKEIGKGDYFTYLDPASSVNSSDYLNHAELAQDAPGSLNLEEKISSLESQLEEGRNALRLKDSQVCELEATLNSESRHKGNSKNEATKQEDTEKLEAELEILFEQKIEADIKYLVTSNALHEAKHAAPNPTTLLAEQKALVDEQSHLKNMLKQTESRVVKISRQANELEMCSEEILETEQSLSLKQRIGKLKRYSLAQFLILLLALWIAYLQVVSDSGVVVPT